MRSAAWAIFTLVSFALSGAGCSTLGVPPGAIPTGMGQTHFTASASLQRGASPLSNALGLPLPQLEVAWRRGLAEDLDLGLRLYPVGALVDVRYRFLQAGGWSWAVTPGIGGVAIPIPGSAFGNLDLHLPLSAERPLAHDRAIALSASAIARQNWVWLTVPDLGSGAGGRFELDVGAAAWRWQGRASRYGLYAQVLGNATRGGPPLFAVGIESGWVE